MTGPGANPRAGIPPCAVGAPQRCSVAAVACDRQGRVLFIHSRTPRAVHDLIEGLLALPIDIQNAMCVEEGPMAQVFVDAGGQQSEFVGQYETGLLGEGGAAESLPPPTVIGVVRRQPPGGVDESTDERSGAQDMSRRADG